MTRSGCRAVFPRDRLTHSVLQDQGILSQDCGNPMMDGLESASEFPEVLTAQQPLTLALLPGSRFPEAVRNWQLMVQSLVSVLTTFPDRPLKFLAAIAPSLNLDELIEVLSQQHWQPVNLPFPADPTAQTWHHAQATLTLTQRAFADCLHQAQGAIAMAGTATEQLVGLGKPAVTLPGQGPQFNPYFARRQTYLLGESVILVDQPDQVGPALQNVFQDQARLTAIARNGRERLGVPGAAERIAKALIPIFADGNGTKNFP